MRRKIIATFTVFAFGFVSFMPTIALAANKRPAPKQGRPAIKREIKRPSAKHDAFRKANIRQQRKIERLNRNARRIVRNRQPVRHWYYSGMPYYYRGYYNHHYRAMHKDAWIALIGLAAFNAMLNNRTIYQDNTVVVNSSGRIVRIDDPTIPTNTVILDSYGNVIPIYHY